MTRWITPAWSSAPGRLLALLACLALLLAAGPARAQQRLALVIGNGAYREAPLPNPVNDARAVAEVLRAGGFQVVLKENLDHRAMQQAVRDFGDRLRSGGVGLFYFAGHGMQIKGRNYLIPVGTAIEREDEVAYAALDAQAVLDKMEAAGNGTNMMVLDACRSNPFARSFRSNAQGLAQMDAPVGTLVAFATAPGSVASDGSGANGLYTQHLLAHMREPGLKVEEVFKRTRAAVRRESAGRQVPWESTSLEGDLYFMAPRAAEVSPQQALEQAMWDMVRRSNQPLELKAYLARFPRGRHADEARMRLAGLEGGGLQPAAAAPRPPSQPSPGPRPQAQAAAPASAAEPPLDTSDAAVEQRTNEILAELAKGAPGLVAQMGKPVPVKASLAAAAVANGHGFRVGDRWRFQTVDKSRGEVIDNYTMKVDRILPGGDMSWNGSQITATPQGNFRRNEHPRWPLRKYDGADVIVPERFEPGWRQEVRFSVRATRDDGFSFTETYAGALVVKERERVRVPAGEFDAWRVERDTTFSGEQDNGASRWFGRNLFTGWWVPELRTFVARDTEHRIGTGVATRLRHELTSFEVAGARVAQR